MVRQPSGALEIAVKSMESRLFSKDIPGSEAKAVEGNRRPLRRSFSEPVFWPTILCSLIVCKDSIPVPSSLYGNPVLGCDSRKVRGGFPKTKSP